LFIVFPVIRFGHAASFLLFFYGSCRRKYIVLIVIASPDLSGRGNLKD
jgi:hypothetical protein